MRVTLRYPTGRTRSLKGANKVLTVVLDTGVSFLRNIKPNVFKGALMRALMEGETSNYLTPPAGSARALDVLDAAEILQLDVFSHPHGATERVVLRDPGTASATLSREQIALFRRGAAKEPRAGLSMATLGAPGYEHSANFSS